MRIKLSHITIVLLMLFMQSAAALHELDHQSYEHSEQCRAFTSADHADAVIASAQVLPVVEFDETYLSQAPSAICFSSRLSFFPRAPPKKA